MKSSFLFFTIIFWTNLLFAANPDQGLLARMVCYEVTEAGDLSTRDSSITYVVQQISAEHNDASYFVPGNSNYNSLVTSSEDFQIYVYRNADELSLSTDAKVYAEELLANDPTIPVISATGLRAKERLGINWGSLGNELYFSRNNQGVNNFQDNNTDGVPHNIYCEDPFGISIEEPAPEQPQEDQSAELTEEVEETAAEI